MALRAENKTRITLNECLGIMSWYWDMYKKFKKVEPTLSDKEIKKLIKEYLDQ